ncbi:MAG TPA: ThuA domain-containing protein [Chloroflexota bacterium]|jgi:type 1 glutamine amidotransferase|nr:ThuA domain-containing protein [Chloroflexota bacterium]
MGEQTNAVVLFSGGHARPSTRAALAEFLWGLPWLQVTITDDWDALRWERLAPYDLLVTYTGGRDHACTPEQLAGVTRFVERGGGFAPLHFTTMNGNAEFLALVGAKFVKHPPHGPFTVRVADPDHPITQGLPTIEIEDECYQSEYPDRAALRVLQTSHHTAGIDGEPSSWVREIGRGRLFYSALGHDARSFAHPQLRELLNRGLRWAAGLTPVQTGQDD